jgi:transcriptional regulator with XRE-family HTH domain
MAERDIDISELPLDGAGTRLRRAREAAGLSLADVAARTRIAERHLAAIENGDFAALASRAYAVGFARSFARVVALDEKEIAAAVSAELAGQRATERYQPAVFEPGDPARVPGAQLAWIAALAALLVVSVGYFVWRSFYAPAGDLPALVAEETPADIAATPAPPQPAAPGQVVFTALEPGVWVKFYDAAGTQLMQKEMALGESYAVPPEASGPMIRTARPDALQVSIDGRIVPKLAEGQTTLADVPVSAAALLARAAAPQAAAMAPQPVARPQAAPRTSRPPAPVPVASAPAATPTDAAPTAAADQGTAQSSTVSQ